MYILKAISFKSKKQNEIERVFENDPLRIPLTSIAIAFLTRYILSQKKIDDQVELVKAHKLHHVVAVAVPPPCDFGQNLTGQFHPTQDADSSSPPG